MPEQPPGTHDRAAALAGLLALSGAAALLCEVVWLRRLSLAFGSTGLALTLTLSVYMGGLGLGGWLGGRRRWRAAPGGYGRLELAAAAWAAAMPVVIGLVEPIGAAVPGVPGSVLAAVLTLGPPAVLHGATLPAASAAVGSGDQAGRLYAANTTGAVAGVLLGPLLLLPLLGVRGTELAAAGLGATAGVLALLQARDRRETTETTPAAGGATVPAPLLVAAAAAGFASLALEVAWSRLGSLLLGGSIYAVSTVLAVFLLGTAAGAALGRRLGPRAVAPALAALGLLAVAGAVAWRVLPHGLGLLFAAGGEGALGLGGALLVALAMGGAPVASGVVFTGALASADDGARGAGRVLAANTLGSVLGAGLAGLVGLPLLGLRGLVAAVGLGAVLLAASLPSPAPRSRRLAMAAATLALVLLAPRWDPALYSVGLYLRLGDFADLSPRAVERFAHGGFRLLSYEDGVSATVAVGESLRTGNRWLAINGKVDASTGDDMPTQELSGRLPVEIFRAHRDRAPSVLVVGLASGVTARAALDAGAASLTVVELEPAVVRAAAAFSAVNGDLLHDPRVTVVVADARSWLRRRPPDAPPFDVIISEPSNPWITGVSNLFTQEYWLAARGALAEGGVFCQWVQLYALPPDAMRGLVATFLTVFPGPSLYETIPGADALLITGAPPDDLALLPTLRPGHLRALSARGRLNTDDQPWIELEAPRWLHRPTGATNAALIQEAAR
ncbi:MAG: hypothetical protein H6742_02975 [Alphaproteobacteria bacterium]|nr:hypothetical protein [Alphaproteobacteria bacterium]